MADESQRDETPKEDPNATAGSSSKSAPIAQEPAKKAGKTRSTTKDSGSKAKSKARPKTTAQGQKTASASRSKPSAAKEESPAKRLGHAAQDKQSAEQSSKAKAARSTGASRSAAAGAARATASDPEHAAQTHSAQAAGHEPKEKPAETRSMDWFWRLLAIVAFGFLSYVLLLVSWVVAAAQYIVILVRGKPNRQLVSLMAQIAAYLRQILEYLAGRTSATHLPFPFGELPKAKDDEKDDDQF